MKKLRLSDLRNYDLTNDESLVRSLEMTLDGVITSPGYQIQFWRDAQTYGIDEVILYVKNGNHASADGIAEIEKVWQTILEKIKK